MLRARLSSGEGGSGEGDVTFKSKSVKFTFLLFLIPFKTFAAAVSEKRSGLADFEDFSPNLKFF